MLQSKNKSEHFVPIILYSTLLFFVGVFCVSLSICTKEYWTIFVFIIALIRIAPHLRNHIAKMKRIDSYGTDCVQFFLPGKTPGTSCAETSSENHNTNMKEDVEKMTKDATVERKDWEWLMPHLFKELQSCEFGASLDRELQKEAIQTRETLKTIFYTGLGEKLDSEQLERFCDRYLNPLSKELRRWDETTDIMAKLQFSLSDMESEEIPASVKEFRLNLIKTLQAVRNAATEMQVEILATQADVATANLKTIQSVLLMDGYDRPMKAV